MKVEYLDLNYWRQRVLNGEVKDDEFIVCGNITCNNLHVGYACWLITKSENINVVVRLRHNTAQKLAIQGKITNAQAVVLSTKLIGKGIDLNSLPEEEFTEFEVATVLF